MVGMNKITKIADCFMRDESGATAIEYTLLVTLMGVALIPAVGDLSAATVVVFNFVEATFP